MRCDASHRLDQERDERHVPRTMPFTEERLADGLLVERARAEIGADEPPLLDQPKLLQFPSGQGIKPLHHLPRGKVPVFRLAHAAGARSARFIHGLDAALCPSAVSDKKIHPQLQKVGRRGSFADRAQPRTRVGNLVDKLAHHRFAKGPETFMTE